MILLTPIIKSRFTGLFCLLLAFLPCASQNISFESYWHNMDSTLQVKYIDRNIFTQHKVDTTAAHTLVYTTRGSRSFGVITNYMGLGASQIVLQDDERIVFILLSPFLTRVSNIETALVNMNSCYIVDLGSFDHIFFSFPLSAERTQIKVSKRRTDTNTCEVAYFMESQFTFNGKKARRRLEQLDLVFFWKLFGEYQRKARDFEIKSCKKPLPYY